MEAVRNSRLVVDGDGISLTTSRMSANEKAICIVALAILSTLVVASAAATPFTAGFSLIPALVFALAALGVGAYMVYKLHGHKIKAQVNEVSSNMAASAANREQVARQAALDVEQENRKANTEATLNSYRATHNGMAEKYGLHHRVQ